jgi:hypothetical protein
MLDKIRDKIQDLYWTLLPYDWRPGQIWYRFACWSWRRYSTVKPRYLGHTWVDMDELLAQTIFEILSRFVEKEMDIIDWDYNDEYRHAKSEIMSLYHWWHDNYNKSYIEDGMKLWAETHKYTPEITWKPCENKYCVKMVTTWKNPDDEKKYHELLDESIAIDAKHETELKTNMIRLINIKEYLWS